MPIQRVFNGNSNTNNINRTISLTSASALFCQNPTNNDEYEIDFYLQLEISNTENRLIRLNDSFTIDTLTIYPIPTQLQISELSIYGAFITTFPLFLEIWGIFPETNLENISNQLDTIESIVRQNRVLEVAQTVNEIAQNTSLAILSTALAPITAGTSLPAVPVLTGGTGALTPLLPLPLP